MLHGGEREDEGTQSGDGKRVGGEMMRVGKEGTQEREREWRKRKERREKLKGESKRV